MRNALDSAASCGRWILLAFAAFFGVATSVTAEELETRVYDARDLITPIPDFVIGIPGDARQVESARPTRDELEANVLEFARMSGGDVSSFNGQLVVRQNAASHDELSARLDRLRALRYRQVNVGTRFLLIDPGKLPRKVRDDLSAAIGAPAAFVSKEQLDTLLHLAREDQNVGSLTAPSVTAFNGQLVRVVGEPRAGGFADAANLLYKVALDLRAVLSADRRYMAVTLEPAVAAVTPGGGEAWTADADVTLSLPDGGTVAVVLRSPENEPWLLMLVTTQAVGDREHRPPELLLPAGQ